MLRSCDVGLESCGCRLSPDLRRDSDWRGAVMKPWVDCPCSDLAMFGCGVAEFGGELWDGDQPKEVKSQKTKVVGQLLCSLYIIEEDLIRYCCLSKV